MYKRLSSLMVPVYKLLGIIVPLLMLADWVRREEYDVSVLLFVALWASVWNLFAFRLKNVCLEGDRLRIYDFWQEVTIPVSEIENVENTGWWRGNPRRIILKLRRATVFGNKIAFVPAGLGFANETITKELRNLIAQARLVRKSPWLRK